MPVYEYLTLTDREAMLILDTFNGTLIDERSLGPGLPQTVAVTVEDNVRLNEMDKYFNVDGEELVVRLLHLSPDQAWELYQATQAFWESVTDDSDLYTTERLSAVGLV